MTEKELEQLLEQKKAQAKTTEFERTQEEFIEEFFRMISTIDKNMFSKDMRLKRQKCD